MEKEIIQNEVNGVSQAYDRLKESHENLLAEYEIILEESKNLKTQIYELNQVQSTEWHERFNFLLRTQEEAAKFVNIFVQGILRKHHHKVYWGDRLLTIDKAAGFWEEQKFVDAYNQIKESQVYDQYSGPDGIAWRLNTLVWAARCACELPGDFVECGVFKGDMSWVVTKVVNWIKIDKTFYLYDTFEGFSLKYTSQEDFPLNPNFMDFANKVYRIPGLYEQVCERFNEYPNVKIIKGILPDSLLEESPEQIAFLHIDLNSVKPEIGVLEILFDHVVSGGIIVFDDYGWIEYMRQKRAEDEFMRVRGYEILELPTGQGLVIKR